MIDDVETGAPVADVSPTDEVTVDVVNQETDAEVEGEKVEEPTSEKPQKRMTGWERQRERLKVDNANKAQRILELEQQLSGRSSQKSSDEPKETDFDNVLDYVVAKANWEAGKQINAYKEEQSKIAAQAEFEKLAEIHTQREEAFEQEYPDYAEKVQAVMETGIVTEDIQNAVLRSDMSEKVAYHLANHPSDLVIMAGLKDKAALKQAVSTIETYIKANPFNAAVKQTRAAAPITPVKGKASPSTKPLHEMTQREYEVYERKLRIK